MKFHLESVYFKRTLGLVFFLLIVSSLCEATPQTDATDQRGDARQLSDGHDGWRKAIQKTLPPEKGCFTASYPETSWTQVDCQPAPVLPYSRPPHPGHLETVGNGTDYIATVSSGKISVARGAFLRVTDVTSESDGSANVFSLQLNSQLFTSTACNGVSGCSAWEQFVYSSHVYGGAFIQNWLINYGASCPGGWTSGGSNDCFQNSTVVSVPSQTITDLPQLVLEGTANSGSTDAVILYAGDNAYSASEGDGTVDLAASWTTSEFNIVGDGGGSEATFNTGATLVVTNNVANATVNAPSCTTGGTTGETNSLTLVAPCCPYGGASPGIVFMESSAAGATTSCASLRSKWLPAVLTLLVDP